MSISWKLEEPTNQSKKEGKFGNVSVIKNHILDT